MLGDVHPDALPDLIGAADVFAYSSLQGTNVPVAILEAMACARLVVATDQPPSAHELLADGRGIVVPAGDVDAYAKPLSAAVSMGEARAPRRGRRRAAMGRGRARAGPSPARACRCILGPMTVAEVDDPPTPSAALIGAEYWDRYWSRLTLPREYRHTPRAYYLNAILDVFDRWLPTDRPSPRPRSAARRANTWRTSTAPGLSRHLR